MKKTNLKLKRKPSRKKRPVAPHVRASLFSVAPHKHTGHRLAHKHTSHGALLVILILAGIILFVGIATLKANADNASGQVSITANVNGDPPTQGAVMTSPVDKTKTNSDQLQVTGTCPTGTVVAIYNGGTSIGSTVCSADAFSLSVQINVGINVLQAQDYDALDQAGPVTGQISVEYVPTAASPSSSPTVSLPTQTTDPAITAAPAPQPAANPCFQDPSSQIAQASQLSLTLSCVTRNVFVGETVELPIAIAGGVGPYAITVDWGDSTPDTLRSFAAPGNYTIDHVYQVANIKQLVLHLADSTGVTYQTQTVISVNGTDTTGAAATNSTTTTDTTSVWTNASVPIYAGLAILVLGFWVGDIFQRFINVKKRRRHS